MIITRFEKTGDDCTVEFDHDGIDTSTVFQWDNRWSTLKDWHIDTKSIKKFERDLKGKSVEYRDVFGSDPTTDDQQTVAKVVVPVTMYDAIASYFDEWAPCPPGSHIAHHKCENDVDADGNPTYVVWGVPFSLMPYWDIMEPHLKANYPGKFWQAIKADKKPILIEYLKMLRTQREKAE